MKAVVRLLLCVCALTVCAFGAHSESAVFAELFTSEGCSSCPPVDALIQKLDASQPIPGVQLVVLSEHVTYWNHDGWKDPYSSSLATNRQLDYERVLNVDDPYTPQIIVDGTTVVRSYDPHRLAELFQKAAVTPKVSVDVSSVRMERMNPPILRVRVEAKGDSASSKADVYLAIALDHAASQVSAGENNGKHLMHVAVLQSLRRLGRFESGKAFTEDCRIRLKDDDTAGNVRVIAFVQVPGPGQVLGAVMQKAASTP